MSYPEPGDMAIIKTPRPVPLTDGAVVKVVSYVTSPMHAHAWNMIMLAHDIDPDECGPPMWIVDPEYVLQESKSGPCPVPAPEMGEATGFCPQKWMRKLEDPDAQKDTNEMQKKTSPTPA